MSFDLHPSSPKLKARLRTNIEFFGGGSPSRFVFLCIHYCEVLLDDQIFCCGGKSGEGGEERHNILVKYL